MKYQLLVTVSKSSYIGNPSPAPPNDVNFYSVEIDNGRYMGYETNHSPIPVVGDPGSGSYYPSMSPTGHMTSSHMSSGTSTLTRSRTLPRPVPPPDVTVMTAGSKSPIPPSVPPPPTTFARSVSGNAHTHGHPLSTFTPTPAYSDIDGHLVWGSPIFGPSSVRGKYRAVPRDETITVTERTTRL